MVYEKRIVMILYIYMYPSFLWKATWKPVYSGWPIWAICKGHNWFFYWNVKNQLKQSSLKRFYFNIQIHISAKFYSTILIT